MAEGGAPVPNLVEPNWEKLKKIRKLRELYKGRFTEDQCGVLLRYKNYDLEATVEFMFLEPREIRHVIGDENWQDVGEELRSNARNQDVSPEIRQFACRQCDNVWWRKVPSRKQVSKCHKCKKRYKAIRKEREYGTGRFHCDPCNRDFLDFGMMDLRILQMGLIGKSQAYCYRCYLICEPIEILPPRSKKDRRRRRRRRGGEPGRGYGPNAGYNGPDPMGRYRQTGRDTAHNYFNGLDPMSRYGVTGHATVHMEVIRQFRQTGHCTAHNCYNRMEPMRDIPVITFCVHPRSLGKKVAGLGSDNHKSTGSTVDTFLSQDDLEQPYEPSLGDISEDPGDNY